LRRNGFRAPQRARDGEGGVALGVGEVAVAAGQRQAVRLPHRRHAHNLDRKVQVAHHPPDQRELLRVLAPEHRDVRPGQVQQLRDDGEDAVEVAGPRTAFQHVAERPGAHRHERAFRVDDVRRRREDQVHALRLAGGQVGVERAGVAVEVLVRAELERVHEDGRDRAGRAFARDAHQRAVALVQRAHRHHDGGRAVEFGSRGGEVGAGRDDVHGVPPARASSSASALVASRRPSRSARSAVRRASAV
jgi:hypothetical protein